MPGMSVKLRRLAALIAIATARNLPVRWLRSANRLLHHSAWGRRLLNVVWMSVADEPVLIPRGVLVGWKFAAGGGQPGYLLGASEPDLQEVLQKHICPGDVVYDVGANVGFFTLVAARLATRKGRIYAFEPIDANVRALRRNLELNGIQHAEVVETVIRNTCAAARMSLSNNQATPHLADHGDDLVSVQSTTIDAFVAAGHRPPTVVKIDVEGAENLVLAGMPETLRQHRPMIVCELHYDRTDYRRDAITNLLADARYDEQELPLDGGSMPHLLAVPRAP